MTDTLSPPQLERKDDPLALRLGEIRAREAAATAGPWRWEVNPGAHEVNLQGGVHRYDISVVRFVRWGMNRAAPTFLTGGQSPLTQRCERVEHFMTPAPGREHHASWFQLVDHPDAAFIEHARADVRWLLDRVDALEAQLAEERRS